MPRGWMPPAPSDADTSGTPATRARQPLSIRSPRQADGGRLWRLARDTETLDLNSPYSYLLWCRDFAGTSAVACDDGVPCAFLTGYRRPAEPAVLFIWQIMVLAPYRDRRVARSMLDDVWNRASTDGCSHVEATVTSDNTASARLFESFAQDHGARLRRAPQFQAHQFPVAHAAETLFRIGPISRPARDARPASTDETDAARLANTAGLPGRLRGGSE